jgi:hypothetical protein
MQGWRQRRDHGVQGPEKPTSSKGTRSSASVVAASRNRLRREPLPCGAEPLALGYRDLTGGGRRKDRRSQSHDVAAFVSSSVRLA